MRVFLADDQAEVRSALRLLLEQEAEVIIVGEAAAAEPLLGQIAAAHPDVILLDWELPGCTQPGWLAGLRTGCPDLRVVALSGRPEARAASLASGVTAFVSKGEAPERLLAVLQQL